MEHALKHDLIFVVGRTASGKSTVASRLLSQGGRQYVYLETSDVIKKITGDWKRSNIAFRPELDVAVVEAIKKELQYNNVIVSGTRQWSIIEPFADFATIIWVSVPFAKREAFFKGRADASDDVTLKDIDDRDNALGIEEIARQVALREQQWGE
mgnify:CR=1 FL=1